VARRLHCATAAANSQHTAAYSQQPAPPNSPTEQRSWSSFAKQQQTITSPTALARPAASPYPTPSSPATPSPSPTLETIDARWRLGTLRAETLSNLRSEIELGERSLSSFPASLFASFPASASPAGGSEKRRDGNRCDGNRCDENRWDENRWDENRRRAGGGGGGGVGVAVGGLEEGVAALRRRLGGAKAMVAEAPRAHEHVRALRRCTIYMHIAYAYIHVYIMYILGGAKAMVAKAPRAHEHVRALRRCAIC